MIVWIFTGTPRSPGKGKYALMPQMLRDYMASREYNPDKICVFAASDDGNTLLAPDGAPEMRCAYWSYKK